MSDALLPGSRWLLPGAELLLAALIAVDPHRVTKRLVGAERDLRAGSLGLVGLVALANSYVLVRLIDQLVGGGGNGRDLLAAAAGVWLTNVVVFALAYWELDRGGPFGRAHKRGVHHTVDLWFPQNGDAAAIAPDWSPVFVDYLFVSLTASTAFSPTDTMPLTPQAKLLMGAQSLVSLLTVGLVAARAVNILG